MSEEKESMYDLALNDVLQLDMAEYIRRVPGGWIYEYCPPVFGQESYTATAVFVPYNEEFIEEEQGR